MLHPYTELRYVSPEIGYGVFATCNIPMGTIIYASDDLEICITPDKYTTLDKNHREIVDKYSYIDAKGIRIVSWDHAKYINHSCNCNTMSTGYGFEIAIRDIKADEEITDEYGLFNIEEDTPINCGCINCRKYLYTNDLDTYGNQWDKKVQPALQKVLQVEQPLWYLLDDKIYHQLLGYLAGEVEYRSVIALKFTPTKTVNLHNNIASKKAKKLFKMSEAS
ncbi:SET domain-containing protein [Aliikangiella maris]|uniref:SET domain-containing protein n=2 Tax=Aliikangiella maris TaxID=3162458 RepID=A0ABV2BP38_9GAMM